MGIRARTETNLYEQAVQFYLGIFEHFILMPQFLVVFKGKGKVADENWQPCFLEDLKGRSSAYDKSLDFLAVDVKRREAQVVEVTKALPPGEHLVKMLLSKRREDDHLTDGEIIERYVKWFLGEGFTIRWRFFFPGGENDEYVEGFMRNFENKPISDKVIVTPLEDVFDKLRSERP
jgi:hypothetical protein